MRMVKTLLTLLVALLALGPFAAGALASPEDVLIDCQDGVLDDRHSRGDLRSARGQLQGDVGNYSNCGEVISRALTSTGSEADPSRRGAAGGAGLRPTAPGDVAAFTDEQGVRRDAAGVPVDGEGRQVDPQTFARDRIPELDAARRGERIVPTAGGVRPDEPGTSLPAPLVALIAVCVLAALGAATTLLRRRPLLGRPA